MAHAPAKEKNREEKDNIFLAIFYSIVIQIPAMVIAWFASHFVDD